MTDFIEDLPRLRTRLAAIDWRHVEAMVDDHGYARVPDVLERSTCAKLATTFEDEASFRKRVDMEQHAFGVGQYGYFAEPLPAVVATLREELFAGVAPMANALAAAVGRTPCYPPTLAEYRAQCHAAGQTKPTPLLLRYGEGGYNRLHQDLYGDLLFPLQATVLLSEPERDFRGGEFLLVENRPRQQAIATALSLQQGELVLFPVAERPVAGKRAMLRARMRHGVSRVTRGERFALGVIFHDAA